MLIREIYIELTTTIIVTAAFSGFWLFEKFRV